MVMTRRIDVNGHRWAISAGCVFDAEVIIPVETIEAIGGDEVGRIAHSLITEALELRAEQYHSWLMVNASYGAGYSFDTRRLDDDTISEAIDRLSPYYYLEYISDTLEKLLIRQETRRMIKAAKMKPGSVYVLQCGDYYKIGRTSNLEKRLKSLSISVPYVTRLVCAIKTEDSVSLEAVLHAKFGSKRHNGEWFKLNCDDIYYLEQLAEMEDVLP